MTYPDFELVSGLGGKKITNPQQSELPCLTSARHGGIYLPTLIPQHNSYLLKHGICTLQVAALPLA